MTGSVKKKACSLEKKKKTTCAGQGECERWGEEMLEVSSVWHQMERTRCGCHIFLMRSLIQCFPSYNMDSEALLHSFSFPSRYWPSPNLLSVAFWRNCTSYHTVLLYTYLSNMILLSLKYTFVNHFMQYWTENCWMNLFLV